MSQRHATQRCHQNILVSQQPFQPKQEKSVRLIKQIGSETFVAQNNLVQCFANTVL